MPTIASTSPDLSPILSVPHGINPAVAQMEYAVRGQLVQRADALSAILRQAGPAASALPFDRVIYCNIGNPQSVGQTPITFIRQVLSVLVNPSLLDVNPCPFPSDVVNRARGILHASHGVGAYSESPGIPMIREDIAKAITKRDGGHIETLPENIFLTNGASDAVKSILSMIIRKPCDGVMIPIPQYPLYSAALTAFSASSVPYYLREDPTSGWSLHVEDLRRSLDEARSKGITVRALVIINPGNPTSHVLPKETIEDIVKFCSDEGLLLMADEVYQNNVYDGAKFHSFKRAVHELKTDVELASFHSVSKGFIGECGLRGGYVELCNINKEARDMLYKVLSVSLCSNIIGQAAMHAMMYPPVKGDPSFEQYLKEVTAIRESLARKSRKLANTLNSFEGVSCVPSPGSMYLFPRITLPQKAYDEAQKQSLPAPDVLYCLEMLESTGICTVPGSGFGQEPGTLHFRTTFLPSEDEIDTVTEKMRDFHDKFLQKYSD